MLSEVDGWRTLTKTRLAERDSVSFRQRTKFRRHFPPRRFESNAILIRASAHAGRSQERV